MKTRERYYLAWESQLGIMATELNKPNDLTAYSAVHWFVGKHHTIVILCDWSKGKALVRPIALKIATAIAHKTAISLIPDLERGVWVDSETMKAWSGKSS